MQPLALEQDFIGYYENDDGSEHDDHDGDDFYSFYDSDGMYANVQTFNNEDELEVNADVPIEVAASQVGSRRVDKEPIIEHPPEVFHISDISDSVGSDGGGSGLEDDVELIHGVRDFEYTSISRLWYKMLRVDQELADFHLIIDDSDTMYLT